MQARATATVSGPPARARRVIADLATWPRWLDVVTRAQPDASADGRPAWRTRLGLRFGPLDLGFDVRMVRVTDEPHHLRFERCELDGRDDHSAVVIDVVIRESGDGDGTQTALDLDVRIDKRIPLLDLQRELDRRAASSRERLEAVIADNVSD